MWSHFGSRLYKRRNDHAGPAQRTGVHGMRYKTHFVELTRQLKNIHEPSSSHITPPAVYEKPSNILLIATWFGLLTGLAEIGIIVVKDLALHQSIGIVPHVVWMVPLANVVVFTSAGLFLSLLVLQKPKLVPLRAAVLVFAFLSVLCLLLHSHRLHTAAVLCYGYPLKPGQASVGHVP